MAYLVDIEHDFDREPQTEALGAKSIRFIVGYDPASDTAYFMAVLFATMNGEVYDLRFGIEERQSDRMDWIVGMDYSIEYSKEFVPGQRDVVLRYILECVSIIVKDCMPSIVTMQSFYANLPDKAMVKYQKICALMGELGFTISVAKGDGATDKKYWLFKRR